MPERFDTEVPNPFATSQVSPGVMTFRFVPGPNGRKPQVVNNHLELMLSKLQSSKRALIVGPHGTGKTTLIYTFLPKLQKVYPTVAFNHLASDPAANIFGRFFTRLKHSRKIREELSRLPDEGLLIVDGWEQLGGWARYRIVRKASARKITLLATTHRKIPGWPVLLQTHTSAELIRSLAQDLTEGAPHRIKKLVKKDLSKRRLHARTNVRDLWFDLYDLVADAIEADRKRRAFGAR